MSAFCVAGRSHMDEAILDAYERLFFAVVIRARRDLYGPVKAYRASAYEFIKLLAGEDIAGKLEKDCETLRRELYQSTEAAAVAQVSAGAGAIQAAGHGAGAAQA